MAERRCLWFPEMKSNSTNNYGYEYVCPFTGLIDYIGIGNAGHTGRGSGRMNSHRRLLCNGMLRQKLKLLESKGIAPIYRKVVEGLDTLCGMQGRAARIGSHSAAGVGGAWENGLPALRT